MNTLKFNKNSNTPFLDFKNNAQVNGLQWGGFKSPEETILHEIALEKAIKEIEIYRTKYGSNFRTIDVLDLGCGNSIPTLCTLEQSKYKITITGVDTQQEAMRTSSHNANILSLDTQIITKLTTPETWEQVRILQADIGSQGFQIQTPDTRFNIVSGNLPYLPNISRNNDEATYGGKNGMKYTPKITLKTAENVGASHGVITWSTIANAKEIMTTISQNKTFGIEHIYAVCCPLGKYTRDHERYIQENWNPILAEHKDSSYQMILSVVFGPKKDAKINQEKALNILHTFRDKGTKIIQQRFGSTDIFIIEPEEFRSLYQE